MDNDTINRPREDDEQIRDRAIRLFTYLREITELRTKTTRNSDQYDNVLWFDKIPREPGCSCIAWKCNQYQEESDVWLEIKKPRLKAPPKPQVELQPWLDSQEVEDSSRASPDLRERITITVLNEEGGDSHGEKRTAFKELSECPEIQSRWERYVQEYWSPWAEEDRRLKAVQEVYTELFTIYQKQQRLGEAYEVVLGLGDLAWRTPGGYEVKRHIITAQTSLSFDAPRGLISLGPAGEGAKPTLEQDMLDPRERPAPGVLNAIQQQVEAIGDALWDGVQTYTVLKTWIHEASPQGQFDETLAPVTVVSPDPRIHLAPAVILRKRTDRSLLRMFQEIIQQLRDGKPIPIGVKRLVTIMDDSVVSTDDEHGKERACSQTPSSIGEIYFPLPANEEQREIAKRLSSHHGVLVQGPPGTGKSHTIANLICHLLATGQRVLITSHTSRALKALLDRFKTDVSLKEIADLCVILLSDDRNAMQALEDSVQGISDRHNSWDSERNQRKIDELERKLDEARRAEAATLIEMRAIREAEVYRHPRRFGNYAGTAQSIAGRLKEEEPRYSWFARRPEEEDGPPPFSDAEATELLRLLREIDRHREQELTKEVVDPDSLVGPGELSLLVRNEVEAIARFEASGSLRTHQGYVPLAGFPPDLRKSFIATLSDLLKTYDALAQNIQPWAKEAAVHILADRDRAWRELLSFTNETLNAIGDRARYVSRRQITGLGDRNLSEVKAHSVALLQHLEQGGKLRFFPLRPRVVKESLYIIKEVLIDGSRCKEQHLIRYLIDWITITNHLEMLRVRWSSHTQPPGGAFSTQVEEYKDLCEPLEKALELHNKVASLKEMIASIHGLQEPTWHNPEALRALEAVAKAVSLEEELKAARKSLEILEKQLFSVLHSNAHPAVRQGLEAVRSRNENDYVEVYQLLCNLKKAREELKRRSALFQRLEMSCPELASELSASFGEQVWDRRMAEFTSAWNWALADNWLRRFNDPQAQQQLTRALEHHRTCISELIRDLAAAKAWGHCFARLKEHERQHLMAWKDAIRRVGRGTGRYAPMHRRAAREHMEQCRSAIPAWIMPIYRVAETIRPGKESFDVVIVDEASQSGPEAHFLQYLAKKIVVVGDDKQISPDSVGTVREDVELLRQRHILDIPLSDAFGPDTSFFGQAVIRFQGRIRLCEHFRCMPEIIQFSNKLCYQSEPLIPLRQYGAGRLTPVIVTRHISDGYQKGHSPKVVNPPEAEALVNQIKACCEDPAYVGKTMGVISLLGEDQAKSIEQLLLKKIGPEEMEKRDIVCGNAYAFQGTERDIMFLSLVSAPTNEGHIGTLTKLADERRFNVAASRARDQMWLFHTATLNDLGPTCLRYRLLEYCQNPSVDSETVGDLHIEELRAMAKTADRNRVPCPPPFDSWFEVDVCLMIMGRGYRVLPQFAIAGRRIDLLIEGMRGRLAVECDGDAWHGAEQYEEDSYRERMLVRCGLTFWRVRGSTFNRNPEGALAELWGKLAQLGIYPSGQGSQPEDGSSPTKSTASVLSPKPQPTVEPSLVDVSDTRKVDAAQRSSTETTGGLKKPDGKVSNLEGQIPLSFGLVTSHAEESDHTESAPLRGSQIQYRNWDSHPLPDPRASRLDEVVSGLDEIVGAEGPVICYRAYYLYARAAGIQRVGDQIKSIFNEAIRKALRQERLIESNEYGKRDTSYLIVRTPGTPVVVLRTRGDRHLDEIPRSEVGAMMNDLLRQHSSLDIDQLIQSVANAFEIKRVTADTRTMFLEIRHQFGPLTQ